MTSHLAPQPPSPAPQDSANPLSQARARVTRRLHLLGAHRVPGYSGRSFWEIRAGGPALLLVAGTACREQRIWTNIRVKDYEALQAREYSAVAIIYEPGPVQLVIDPLPLVVPFTVLAPALAQLTPTDADMLAFKTRLRASHQGAPIVELLKPTIRDVTGFTLHNNLPMSLLEHWALLGGATITTPTFQEERAHSEWQSMAVGIHALRGRTVFVPARDRNSLSAHLLAPAPQQPWDALPPHLRHQLQAHHADVVSADVHGGAVEIVEIEKGGNLTAALDRSNAIAAACAHAGHPLPKFSIVAHERRRREFERKLARDVYQHMGLAAACSFISYEQLYRGYCEAVLLAR